MKSKLKLSAGILLIFISTLGSRAQMGVAGGLSSQQFDPATGLPMAFPLPEWKATNWVDPNVVLTNVSYDGLPLSEVARSLRDQFQEQFDLLLPGATRGVTYQGNQAVEASWDIDWQGEQIQLRLKNVKASEIFAAMNLLFENNRTPLRWELKVNGHRQIALLRVLVDPVSHGNVVAAGPAREMQRRIYFVGNLIGEEKTGGMTMEQIIKTVTDIWRMADDPGGSIQFHKDAQLLVVMGTTSQIDFMEQTLRALGQKVDREKSEAGQNSAVRETLKAVEQKALKEKTNSGAPSR